MLASIMLAVAIAASAAIAVSVFNVGGTGHHQEAKFLIVASVDGYNDSVDHGAPSNPWPVIQVSKGTMVNITVTNTDHQTHGFQITHYYDSSIFSVAPGQTIHVTFVADQKGTFKIYCSIFCTVHWAMQSGELIVS
jgi:heme/copper-type cytochrome/quinol oxidase subunit 2